MILRYDLQADKRGIHPQQAFKEDGLIILRAEASSYGGCWFIEIKDNGEPIPTWYVPVDWEFTHPDKKFYSDIN